LGKCFEKLGVDENAIKYFKQCVKEDPLLDKGWLSIVSFYTKRLDYQKSPQLYRESHGDRCR